MTRNDQITLEMTQICRSQGLLVVPVCFPGRADGCTALAYERVRGPHQ